jgi:flavin reductase (DIM6/NTAB) family NADH-FMN oxidoreductase RutF
MNENFIKIDPKEINENIFNLIGKDWMLITAGNIESFNTMTASWGGFGILWNKSVAYIFIRPQRFTYSFTEKFDQFTLCFFNDKYRDILKFCGTKSGRDTDKIKETGLLPKETELGNIYFKQSKLIIECKKLYFDDLKPENFIDKSIEKNYPKQDYHRLYIGEIINCFKNIE